MDHKKVEKRLFSDFPPVTTREWEDVIQKDLKGADYEKKLVMKANEIQFYCIGIDIFT